MRRDRAPQRRTHHTAAAATTTWFLSSPSNSFLEQVVSWKWHSVPMINLGETRAGKSRKRLNFRTTTGQNEQLPPDDPDLPDQLGSLETAEAFAVTELKNASSKHEKRNTTIYFLE